MKKLTAIAILILMTFTYCEKEEDIIISNKGYLEITNLKKYDVEIRIEKICKQGYLYCFDFTLREYGHWKAEVEIGTYKCTGSIYIVLTVYPGKTTSYIIR